VFTGLVVEGESNIDFDFASLVGTLLNVG
jgi:hypothetical protein